ncbi:MAG: protein translocase subunit SecD [Alphaproteobacteria bacterium]|nr:protein translocase subunit SecD [Alphaproteobacteria bacterium]
MLYFPRWKIIAVIAIILAGLAYVAPNVLPDSVRNAIPAPFPSKGMYLGLDLRGGSQLLLEVDTRAVLRERLNAIVDDARTALRGAEPPVRYTSPPAVGADNVVRVTLGDAADLSRAIKLIEGLANPVQTGAFGMNQPDIAVTNAGTEVQVRLSDAAAMQRATAAVQQSIEVVRRRIDETGTAEPTIQRQGTGRILVQLPGVDDPDRIKRLLGRTAKLTFQMVDNNTSLADALAGRLPPGSVIVPSENEFNVDGSLVRYVLRSRAIITGEMLVDAHPTTDGRTGQPVVSMRFDPTGSRRFGETTAENVGKRFAIVLDGKVISAPVIQEPILGGVGQISGNFTIATANELAVLLRAGALPAPLDIIEERTVGPGLGADSVRAGAIAAIVAFALCLAYVFAAYGPLFGGIANLALLLNITLLLGALSALQAALTLPGIAGVALTMGMAVDANVLINERIREETAAGKTPFASIDAGYKRAMATIIDSNLTTLISGVILYILGTGPVRGFAVTLSIGILTSMFTAVTFSRLLVSLYVTRVRPKLLPV